MKSTVLDTMSPQYIVNEKGEKTGVLLDLKTFALIVEELEDYYDVYQAEEVLAKGDDEDVAF